MYLSGVIHVHEGILYNTILSDTSSPLIPGICPFVPLYLLLIITANILPPVDYSDFNGVGALPGMIRIVS